MRTLRFLTLTAALAAASTGLSGMQETSSTAAIVRVKFSGVQGESNLVAGKPSAVALGFTIIPGFHINSNTPKSPELIPTALTVKGGDGVTPGKVVYPAGQDIAFPFDPGAKLNVYSGDITVKAWLQVPATATAGRKIVHADFRYQACSDRACFPPKTLPVDFEVTVEKHN